MNLKELQKIIARGEDSQHQFKKDVHNGDSLAAEMVAFSNSQGGRVLIGISNGGELTGLSSEDVDRINQLISNTASQHVRSPISVQTENISVSPTRVAIIITVPEGIDKPYFDKKGIIWLKSGADKRRVNSKEELRRLFQEVDLIHADEVPTRCGLDILDNKLFSKFLQDAYQKTLPKSEHAQLKLLENMNLAIDSKLNLAGLLLFGEKPHIFKPDCIVKAVCFPGSEISNRYLDSEDFVGSFPQIFRGALSFVMRNLRKIQQQKGVNTLGEPEIPESVFEELIVNALIHRDYFIAAPIRLFIFDDRIEIINPGTLPNHLTIEKIRAGNSIQRNPILASFVAKGLLPYRGLGTGIRRALQIWPHIQFIDDREGCLFTSAIQRLSARAPSVVVKKSKNKGALKTQNAPINAPINAPLSRVQRQILDLLGENSTASYDEIAAALGKNRTTIMRNIRKLRQDGLLHRKGSKKTGCWEILHDRNSF